MAYFTESLNWEVVTAPLTYQHPITGETLESKRRAFVNSDTGELISDNLTKGYQIFKNSELTELSEIMAGEYGLTIDHYATHKGGKKVLVAFKRAEQPFKVNGFSVENHLILINSHDGSTCLEVGSNNFLHRCANMFASTKIGVKIRHNSSMDEKVEALKLSIMGVDQALEQELETIGLFQNVKIDKKIIEDVKKNLFGLHDGLEPTTTVKNKLIRFDESLDTELGKLGYNAFGLHNAITHYTTHNFTKKINKDRRDFPMFGKRAEMNAQAFDYCKQLL